MHCFHFNGILSFKDARKRNWIVADPTYSLKMDIWQFTLAHTTLQFQTQRLRLKSLLSGSHWFQANRDAHLFPFQGKLTEPIGGVHVIWCTEYTVSVMSLDEKVGLWNNGSSHFTLIYTGSGSSTWKINDSQCVGV